MQAIVAHQSRATQAYGLIAVIERFDWRNRHVVRNGLLTLR
jgi:hypothetical protein